MSDNLKILILGASYGSLLGTKMAMAGHDVTMVCLPNEVELFNSEGAIVRMPVKGREGLIEVRSTTLSGKLNATGTDANPADYDLIALAMQEPQYRSPGVRELLAKVAASKVPCMSIMNMPPLPYLKRISGLDAEACRDCYADATVWDGFDPDLMTLCSPDPQAFRPPEEPVNVLQVRLPTNFKAARFASDEHTAILQRLQSDIEAIRFDTPEGAVELPVKLKVHDSVFVPLAKWSMLMAGNYRCVQTEEMRPIKDAVHTRRGCGCYGAIREIRECGAIARRPLLRGTRAGRRRAQHRTGGQTSTDGIGPERHAIGLGRSNRRDG